MQCPIHALVCKIIPGLENLYSAWDFSAGYAISAASYLFICLGAGCQMYCSCQDSCQPEIVPIWQLGGLISVM